MKIDLPKLAFIGAFVSAVVGAIIVVGGLGALTSYCHDHPPLGLASGFKLLPPYTALTAEVLRQEKATVTNPNGSFNCGRFFRYDWTVWAMQVVFLMIMGACWWRQTIRRYMPGLVSLGTAVTAWHMYRINYIVTMDPWTTGAVHTDGLVTGGGLVLCCIGNFMMFFTGPVYAEREPLPCCRRPSCCGVRSGVAAPGPHDKMNNSFNSVGGMV